MRVPPLIVVFAALAAVPCRGRDTTFLEAFALAEDRAAVLKDLVPGTDDYYYYHALHYQVQNQPKEFGAILKEWTEKFPDENARRNVILTRKALLEYSTDPAKSLEWIKSKLNLRFDHQRQSAEARAELPSTLDAASVSFSTFEKRAIENTDNLENVTGAGLYRLTQPVEKWKLSEVRALLKRLTRPDFPGLVGVIHRELSEKGAKFGDFPIHTKLTSEQLLELQKLRPELVNNETFTAAVMNRLRPVDTEDADRDPAVRQAWLERLWNYASTLNPNCNSLKANLLYHLLALDEELGRLDDKRLFAYLKLPRPVSYVNPRYKEDREIWKFPVIPDYDPSAFTGTTPVGDDEPLVRRLVVRYLTTAENWDALSPLVSDAGLRGVLAEAKLLSGAEQPQRWVSLLTPEAYQTLRDRTDIEFDPASPATWPLNDVVKLDVWIKNVPSLLVRIYEINTANVHRTTGEEVSTALDLDGLAANHERKLDYTDAPILRSRRTFAFPELSGKRGAWIIEFIGNGKASRALIRKGALRPIVRQTSAGTAVIVLDEKLQPVPKAFAMVGPKRFAADDKGLILLPLSESPGPQKVIIDDGNGFTALETIELQGEKYELDAGFHVPRESLLPGNTATLLVRPSLASNGRQVLLESLEKVKITLASVTLDGTPATAVFPVEKLAGDKETTVEFAVPDRLKSLTFTITGEVKSALTGNPVQLSASDSLKVNTFGVDDPPAPAAPGGSESQALPSYQSLFYGVKDIHLSCDAGNWILHYPGLNGEPYANEEVAVRFHRAEFTKPVDVEMKTGADGIIHLGPLDGIIRIEAHSRDFMLPQSRSNLPPSIHVNSGGPLTLPWAFSRNPLPGEVCLTEMRGDSPARIVAVPGVSAGFIVWKDLTPGTYALYAAGREHTIRVSPGDVLEGHSLTPASTIQLTANRPLTVAGCSEGEAKLPDGKTDPVLIFHFGNVSPGTRVHLFASRFLPEFDAMDSLGSLTDGKAVATHTAWNPSVYLSTRNIGDEYRYVLQRRSATRFAGNMLARPGLLINPWEIAETKTEKELLEQRERARESELLPKPEEPMTPPIEVVIPEKSSSFPQTPTTPPPGRPDLSFLATPGPIALNLRPDNAGNVVVSRASLGDRQYVRVIAVDRESSVERDFSFAAAPLRRRDLRLLRQLAPTQHFSQQNRVTLLEKDSPFRFDDALAAQFQSIGHLGGAHQLFLNLTQNPQLAEFSWLLEWPAYDDTKKRALYSQYACHELHFFLSRKDPRFFESVIKPFLASKREKTFLDEYLLGLDLARHLEPWHYSRLNTLERLLLATRHQAEQSVARRFVQDWLNTFAPNPLRDLFLFETALRGRALIAEQGRNGEGFGFNTQPYWRYDVVREFDPPQIPQNFGTANAFFRYALPGGARADDKRQIANANFGLNLPGADNNGDALSDQTRLQVLGDASQLWETPNTNSWADQSYGNNRELSALFSKAKAGDEESRRKLARLKESQFFLTTRSNSPEITAYGTQRMPLLPTDEAPSSVGGAVRVTSAGSGAEHLKTDYIIQNKALGESLVAADFDSGVGFSPDDAYLEKFRAVRWLADADRFFRQAEKTRVWAEQNYYRLPIENQTAALVPVNRFWRDYALWDGKAAFISTNIADAAGTFTEMVLALAVLDLPFPGDMKAGKMETKDNVLTLTPASRAILFHQDILPAQPDKEGTPLLVSQDFYREGDRYVEQGGEKFDKFVSAEFLTGVAYGCQVVITNPSSSRQRLDVLFQIPAGSMPVKATRRVQSLPVQLDPFRTQTLDFHFYFPEPGKYSHFPVHVSRNTKTAAFAAPFLFNVVARPTVNDPASWDYISQHGTDNDVLKFLEQHNLYFLDLGKMLWRMNNVDFFRRAIDHLKSRHVYHHATWSYAVQHNAAPWLTEFLMASELPSLCGPAFESTLLTVDPVEQQTLQHLEYNPLVNARAHRLGAVWSIQNHKFRAQWESFLAVLACRTSPRAEEQLAAAGYLALQDRIGEAVELFAKVDRAAIAEKLQYEYLRAWLAMCQEDTATARRIATALAAHPVEHWRTRFAAINSQLDELEGKPAAGGDRADRESSHDTLAEKEPAVSLAVENKTVVLKYRNLSGLTVSYYPIDLEFLFSSSPFVSQDAARFGAIRPKQSEHIMLPAASGTHIVALPAGFQSENVLVEVSGGGVTKTAAVYANSLDVQVSESFGQLTVRRAGEGRPLGKAYVKVFADRNGAPVFYKDGYTDLRGKFDYASLSTGDLDGTRRFAILVMSDEQGAVVKEVKPPAR